VNPIYPTVDSSIAARKATKGWEVDADKKIPIAAIEDDNNNRPMYDPQIAPKSKFHIGLPSSPRI
jgi:hypothetical protein